MIKINETLYELNLIDIIQELKEQLAINQIYLFNTIKDLPQDIMVSCPFHKEGQERKPSCGIRKEDGWLHCFQGDTKVITRNGIFPIKDLCNKRVEILNGNGEWEFTTFKNYGQQPLLKLTLTANSKLKTIYATDKHEWIVDKYNKKRFTMDLKPRNVLKKSIT